MSASTPAGAARGKESAAAQPAAEAPSPYALLKGEIKTAIARDPFDAMIVTVLGGALLFFLAESGRNPKVRTYFDALVFISTCASVGYADVFARTSAGKAIASAVMTIGPALSGAMLDVPAGHASELRPEAAALRDLLAEKLDAVLAALRAKGG
jgi:hypothetical protein